MAQSVWLTPDNNPQREKSAGGFLLRKERKRPFGLPGLQLGNRASTIKEKKANRGPTVLPSLPPKRKGGDAAKQSDAFGFYGSASASRNRQRKAHLRTFRTSPPNAFANTPPKPRCRQSPLAISVKDRPDDQNAVSIVTRAPMGPRSATSEAVTYKPPISPRAEKAIICGSRNFTRSPFVA